MRLRIREIAQTRVRYWYRMIRVLLNRECWQVGKDVGNVRNDRPDLIDPVTRELGLFA